MTLLVATRPNLNLRVKEADGTPDVPGVSVVVVSNGTLTNDGGGQVTLNTGGTTLPVVDETALVFKTGSPAITATFDANALTQARVYGLPDASTTLAGLAVANTFTAAQTITPAANSTSTFLVEKSDGADVVAVDTTNGRLIVGQGGAGTGLYMARGTGLVARILSFEGTGNLGIYGIGGGNITIYQGAVSNQKMLIDVSGVTIDGLLISAIGAAGNKIYFTTTTAQVAQEQNRWGIVASYAGGDTENNLMFQSRGGINFLVDGTAAVGTANLKNNFWISANNGNYNATLTALTNTVDDVVFIRHNTTGTPAAGFGAALVYQLESSTSENQNAARIVADWDVATHASRSAALEILISNFSSEVSAAKFDDDAVAGNTRLLLYDVDNGQLERVSVGIADSGGLGYKVLRIAN